MSLWFWGLSCLWLICLWLESLSIFCFAANLSPTSVHFSVQPSSRLCNINWPPPTLPSIPANMSLFIRQTRRLRWGYSYLDKMSSVSHSCYSCSLKKKKIPPPPQSWKVDKYQQMSKRKKRLWRWEGCCASGRANMAPDNIGCRWKRSSAIRQQPAARSHHTQSTWIARLLFNRPPEFRDFPLICSAWRDFDDELQEGSAALYCSILHRKGGEEERKWD